MALIICPECKKQISDTVDSCPSCGYKISEDEMDELKSAAKKLMNVKIFAIISIIFSIIIIIFVRHISSPNQHISDGEKEAIERQNADSNNTVTSETQTAPPAFYIDANQITAEYEANEVAADNKYKGKFIIVNGRIEEIKKDILDKPFIMLVGDQMGFSGVQCSFEKDEGNLLASLSKGQEVRIKGKIIGKMIYVQMTNSLLLH